MAYTETQKQAISIFLEVFEILKKSGIDVVYYNQISGYTKILRSDEFIFKK